MADNRSKDFAKNTEVIKRMPSTPFEGIGKPEPLKGDLSGCWSRRIDEEHRLVYEVKDDIIIVLSMYVHYE